MEKEIYPLFKLFVLCWAALAVIVMVVLFFITAPYGRHTKSSWGPLINNTLGWVIMELPALIVFAFFFLWPGVSKSPVNWIFLAMWLFHYVNRSIVFPLRQPDKSKKMPLVIAASAIFFNSVNGYINGYYLGGINPDYEMNWLYDPRFIIGVILFFTGMAINWQSDNILFNLRKPGETGYKIPQGGMYKYVSAPNYFGEILEWTGWALATWSLPGLAFALWTAANLLPRAIKNHQWYKEQFKEYPSGRKALIPYIF